MKKVLVMNGPNLNLLGTREPGIYGAQTLADVEKLCRDEAARLSLELDFRQSNHEGELLDWLHEAGRECTAGALLGVVFNAGAFTHTSIALHGAIEVFENDLIQCRGTPRDLRAMAADRGLGIDLYQPLRDFEGVADAEVERNLARAERKFDLMETLGAPMMLVCSNVSPSAIDDDARAAAQLYALAERAARRNLRIGYEALAWGRHVSHYEHAWSIVAKADHPHLGVIIDSFHILSLGDDPAPIAKIPGDKIFFLQMADAPRLAMDVLQWSRHYRCFPGQGQFDLARFLEYVLVPGYNGPLSLEIFNDVFREAPVRLTAVDAMQSLLYLESQTRQRLASAAGANPQSSAVQALGRV